MGGLDPVPGDFGNKPGYTLDRVPLHCRVHTLGNFFQMAISVICMSLHCGRKEQYSEESNEARGEHANSVPTDSEAGLNFSTLDFGDATPLCWLQYIV